MRKIGILTLVLAFGGLAGLASAQTVVSGDITSDTTWGGAANPCPIILDGPVTVNDGGVGASPNDGSDIKTELTILPGCTVRGQPRSGPDPAADAPGSLIISQTGRLIALGGPSSANVIIFTTAATDNDDDGIPDESGGFLEPWNPGDTFYDDTPRTAPLTPLSVAGLSNVQLWGGLVLLGNAPINTGTGCATGVEGTCNVEGLAIPGFPLEDASYGGAEVHDSCGELQYVSVRHGGDEIGTANEINGITIGGCGDGTLFDFIEVYTNFDDGIEWFGGTINGSHLVVTTVGDDGVDTDQGYTGINQFAFLVAPWFGEVGGGAFGSASGDKLCECDGDDFGSGAGASTNCLPSSDVWFWNVTGIGGDQPQAGESAPDFTPGGGDVAGVAGNDGWEMRHGFGGALVNSLIINTTGNLVDVTTGSDGNCPGNDTTAGRIDRCELQVFSSTFDDYSGTTSSLGTPEDAALACGDDDSRSACPGAGCNVLPNAPPTRIENADTSFDPSGLLCADLSAVPVPGHLDPCMKSSPMDPTFRFGFSGIGGGLDPAPYGLDPGATFRGAFQSSLTTLWVDDWTVLSIAGLIDN